MLPSVSATTPLVFHPLDDQAYALNFTAFGIGDRLIAAVNSLTPDPAGLAFSNLTANAGTISGEHEQDVAAGKAATFRMTGGVAGQDYDVTCQVRYDDGSIANGVFQAQCRDE